MKKIITKGHFMSQTKLTVIYSSNQITKKEPKSEDRLSKFDWHDLNNWR